MPDVIDWDGLIAEVLQRGTDVPEVPWFKPGEDAAYDVSLADSPPPYWYCNNIGYCSTSINMVNRDLALHAMPEPRMVATVVWVYPACSSACIQCNAPPMACYTQSWNGAGPHWLGWLSFTCKVGDVQHHAQ